MRLGRLLDFEPRFDRSEDRVRRVSMRPAWYEKHGWQCETTVNSPREVCIDVPTLAEAQSLWTTCPVCRTHGLRISLHGRGLLDHQGSHNREGRPSRWHASGTGLADLTLQPSVDCGCWHGYITAGEVTKC